MPLNVNVRCLNGPLTGVQRYTYEILQGIEKNKYTPLGNNIVSGVRGHIWEQFALPQLASDGVLWSPGNTGPLYLKNQVVTIHDVSTLDHPEWFSKSFASWYRFALPRLARSCKKIITVSEFSKERIIKMCGVEADKVEVTYLGVGKNFINQNQPDNDGYKKYQLEEGKYFLIVASIEPRKNIERAIDAWKSWSGRPKELKLVIVGGYSSIFSQDNNPSKALDGSILYVGRLSDGELASLYKGALGFIYVSLYEGFGLPVLEAMAAGLPVLTSNLTAIPEVVGKAALLVDPYNVDEIQNGMRRIALDSHYADELRNMSIERAKEFTWRETVAKTVDILEGAEKK